MRQTGALGPTRSLESDSGYEVAKRPITLLSKLIPPKQKARGFVSPFSACDSCQKSLTSYDLVEPPCGHSDTLLTTIIGT